MDYNALYRSNLPLAPWTDVHWDLYVSAYDASDRVKACFQYANATRKDWLILPEYGFKPAGFPPRAFAPSTAGEAEFAVSYLDALKRAGLDVSKLAICVDITGFLSPYLLALVAMLRRAGCRRMDALYAEPDYYAAKEQTRFTEPEPSGVRQVEGFEGRHGIDLSNDVLIIGVGYNDRAISFVAESKPHARKYLLYGLPSLQPDMYQENVISVHRASESLGPDAENDGHIHFAPANNPFVAAEMIRTIVHAAGRHRKLTNLYLSPLSTKAQALGFALYWLDEWDGKEGSVLFPMFSSYRTDSSHGVTRIWRYTLE